MNYKNMRYAISIIVAVPWMMNAMEKNSLMNRYLSHIAMMAPDVTSLKCQGSNTIKIYQDFCNRRVKKTIPWAITSWASLGVTILKPTLFTQNKSAWPVLVVVASLFAMRQTYFLGRNIFRNDLAQKENLSYLNWDVLEQLGSPSEVDGRKVWYVNTWERDCYKRNIFGQYKGRKGKCIASFSLESADGVNAALSGKYTALKIDYKEPSYESVSESASVHYYWQSACSAIRKSYNEH